MLKNLKVALVHDWFLSKSISGSEKVTFALDNYLSNNFSQPEIYSLTEDIRNSNHQLFKGRRINTSFIQKLPFGKNNIQKYLPLIPFAIEQLDLSKYDFIISSAT